MGSTNRTTNYELSQFVGNDKPSWLSDYNGDMAKIDTAIKARSVEAGAAQTTADTANGKADALDTRMGTAENNITALQNASTTDHTQIATNTANISKNAQDIVQLDAKIGHTQITIGDHTVTGAIATLAGQGGVEADNVAYDNQTSGLTADDVQEAIDELAARPTVADASDVTFDNTGTTLQATNVEDAIKEVASSPASNVRYNETTDFLECLVNGSWVQAIYLGLKALIVYLAGVFNYSMSHITGCVETGYTEFTDSRVFQLNQHDMSVAIGALTTTSTNRMATISTSQSVEITGKKLCFDYYLNGDTATIQTVKANAVCDVNRVVTLAAGYNHNNNSYFIYFVPISGTNYTLSSDDFTKMANINSTDGNFTSTDIVHIVKVYCE